MSHGTTRDAIRATIASQELNKDQGGYDSISRGFDIHTGEHPFWSVYARFLSAAHEYQPDLIALCLTPEEIGTAIPLWQSLNNQFKNSTDLLNPYAIGLLVRADHHERVVSHFADLGHPLDHTMEVSTDYQPEQIPDFVRIEVETLFKNFEGVGAAALAGTIDALFDSRRLQYERSEHGPEFLLPHMPRERPVNPLKPILDPDRHSAHGPEHDYESLFK